MSLSPWRSHLARNLSQHRSQPQSRYLQLATVGMDGRPANRTIVFRGFLDRPDQLKTDQLKFVTDVRSQKASHIQHNPYGEVCWYFTKTREQFRIAGTLHLITSDEPNPSMQQARRIGWQELSDSGRSQFSWADPGQPSADSSEISLGEPPDRDHPLKHFCLLLLEPTQVDHLELRGNPQSRCLYVCDLDRNWSSQSINP